MSIIKREPSSAWPVENMWGQDVIDAVFRDIFRTFRGTEGILDRLTEGGTPLMRLEEFVDGDECVIRAELPDVDPEKDVDISISDGVLHLSAERRERSEEERPDGYRSEFRYGRLTRHVLLPEGTSEGDVTASYKDGILEVRVPAPHEAVAAEPRKIPVARG
jgi:HSP20 family protein